jgi:hypothetical protein
LEEPLSAAEEPSSRDQSEVGTESLGSPKRRKDPPAWLVDVSDVDFAGMAAEGRLSKLTANQLKSFLFDKEIPYTGNKTALVDRISAYIADTPEEQRV